MIDHLLEKNIDSIPNPCYILEEHLLRNNLSLIKKIMDQTGVEFILAFKSFALWKSFPIFKEYINSTASSSYYEARLAYEEFGSKTHIYSPAYDDITFNEILKYSSHITFNSLNQLKAFANRISRFKSHISCGLRINPEYSEIETDLYNPCAPGSRFGIKFKDLPLNLPPLVEGFHIHNHCESNANALQNTLNIIDEKIQPWIKKIKWINLGGGHLVTNKGYDINLLIKILTDFKSKYPWLHVILEPGSAFTWNTGTLLSKVVDIVESDGIKTAILNVSFTAHMPDCLEMPYYPTVRYAKFIGNNYNNDSHIYRFGGNSCLSGDYMGMWKFKKALNIGDLIIFEDMIHYTTVKTNMFNGLTHPSIGLLKEDGKFELFRSFEYLDYKNRMC